MKEKLKQLSRRAAVAAGALAVTGAAMAADDAGLAAVTALEAQATSYLAAMMGVVVLCAGGFWSARFLKKIFSKAG